MSWANVEKGRKPIMWWYHKVIAEIGWSLRNKSSFGWGIYYSHLRKLCKYGFNIYGRKI